MPCAAMPVAKPRTLYSRTRSRFSSRVVVVAPTMPVMSTSTAVMVGAPPIFSEMPMAIGIVTDFGAMERSVSGDAPNSHAMPTADTTATTDPARSPAISGTAWRRSFAHC